MLQISFDILQNRPIRDVLLQVDERVLLCDTVPINNKKNI